jgi:hypothetical protein
MGFSKRWASTSDGDYADVANWAATSVRNAAFAWTASGSGTNEYYLRTAAGANPGFAAQPTTVQINGTNATEGTVGSLTAGQFDYADNDTLGYSTLYVRLSDGTDPDTKATDYITFKQTPRAGDDVRIPAGTASINENLDQASVAIGDFIVEEGYEGDIGSDSLGYLRIDPDRFEFSATGGTSYIDVGSAASLNCQIYSTGGPSIGERGLYLLGTSIGVLNVVGGSVGVAVRQGEVSTVTTARLIDAQASLWIGEGCSLTTYQQQDGEGKIRTGGTVTTVLMYSGELTTEETVAITTVNQKGGRITANATGTVTTWNLYAGTLDLQKSGATRTISTLNKYRGTWQLLRNKEAVTITTETPQDTYVETTSA